MRTQPPLLFVTVLLLRQLLCTELVGADLVNIHVKRVIDLTTTTAITRSTIKLKNVGTKPVTTYMLSISPADAASANDVWVTKSKSDKPLSTIPMADSYGNGSAPTTYSVHLSSALQPSQSTIIDLRMDIANTVPAVPSEIYGHDGQYLRFHGSAHFYSGYKTESEQTTLLLPTTSITSKSEIPSPSTTNGKRMELGPYKNTAPRTWTPISVRFRNDRGFLISSRAVKEVRAGHWDTIGVTEEYKLRNGAARHMGEWSRLDYADGFGTAYKTAIGDVWANLPPKAVNVKYTDLIGNITSSRLRAPTSSKRAVQLNFRFPLMGGWKNHFWYTYDVPEDSFIIPSKTSNDFTMKVPIWPTLHLDLLCENFELRVVLPEWAEEVRVVDHQSIKFDVSTAVERMSLNLFGRPVVTLRVKMIRSKSKHQNYIKIQYKYNPMMRWVTPSLTLGCLLIISIVGLLTAFKTMHAGEVAMPKKKTS